MTGSANRRSDASDHALTSPLARAPRFSPPSPTTIVPARKPLHQRSDSQSNQYAGPTIRIVQDLPPDHATEDENVYEKNPFPSQASQILPPRKKPGYSFERKGSRVSDTVAKFEASQHAGQTLVPKPILDSKQARHSTSTNASDADTVVAFSPLSSRFSQSSTSRSSPTPDSSLLFRNDKEFEALHQVPSSPLRSTVRAVPPSTSSTSTSDEPSDGHALTPRASAPSIAPTDSAESLISNNVTVYRNRVSSIVSVSTPPGSRHEHEHTPSPGYNHSSTTSTPQLRQQASAHSFAPTDYSYDSERPRSPSQPPSTIHEAQTATVASGARVNYQAIRAPSATNSWASSQDQLPTITSRMNPHRSQVHQWSSQLSTIASESERGSQSIDRVSRSPSPRSHWQDDYHYPSNGRSVVPRRRHTVSSVSSSDNTSNLTGSSVAVPLPLFSPTAGPSQPGRNSDSDFEERDDTITPLQSPPLKMKTSFMRRRDSDSRSPASSRPSSSASDLSTFITSTIPAWARVYYRRPDRSSLGTAESMTDSSSRLPTSHSGRTNTPSEGNMPFGIYNPRRRPHQRERPSTAGTMSIIEGPVEQDVYVIDDQEPRGRGLFTPRLRPDHRSQAQLSAWKAPSFDENFGAALFSRQNRQIVFFCLGFIFPFAWMIASLMPLPPDAKTVQAATPNEMDLEQRFDEEFGPIIDKSYQKARWWRNLNRIMSAVGTLLIGAIIALAIFASRMTKS